MRVHASHVVLAALAASALLVGCSASGGPTQAGSSGSAVAARIDPQADAALKRMSQALASAQIISFKAHSTMDEPLESGQMGSFTRTSSVVMQRPDKLRAQAHRGDRAWTLWYRGTKLTVLDESKKRYATLEVPGQIDKMFDFMADKYGMVVPLADFMFPNPYAELTEDVLKGEFVGQHRCHGAACDHLLFTQENMDWQIWIDRGTPPVPRKVVMDYKTRPGRPQFVAMLSDWALSSSVDDKLFDAVLPKDAKKVEMSELLKAGEGD